jgi:hypothetical protein
MKQACAQIGDVQAVFDKLSASAARLAKLRPESRRRRSGNDPFAISPKESERCPARGD